MPENVGSIHDLVRVAAEAVGLSDQLVGAEILIKESHSPMVNFVTKGDQVVKIIVVLPKEKI
jgi:hypothetical protein